MIHGSPFVLVKGHCAAVRDPRTSADKIGILGGDNFVFFFFGQIYKITKKLKCNDSRKL